MIQDIGEHKFHNEYQPKPPKKDSILLCYRGREVFAKVLDGKISYPTFAEAEACNDASKIYEDYTYLFSVDDTCFYLGSSLNYQEISGYEFVDTQVFRTVDPRELVFAGVTGWQLDRWYGTRKFCGRCGSRMVHDEKERMMRCPECGLMEFPKICPAVIIGVTHGDKILMSKYAGREFKKYALIAGFAEVGETIEETVRREVMEEVGLKVKNITYYKSQPWSFSDTLLMGFFCELDGEEDITLDEEELAMAEWFTREEMPIKWEGISLTNEMMMVFKEGRSVCKKDGLDRFLH